MKIYLIINFLWKTNLKLWPKLWKLWILRPGVRYPSPLPGAAPPVVQTSGAPQEWVGLKKTKIKIKLYIYYTLLKMQFSELKCSVLKFEFGMQNMWRSGKTKHKQTNKQTDHFHWGRQWMGQGNLKWNQQTHDDDAVTDYQ